MDNKILIEKELAKLVAESEARLAIAKDDKDLQLEIEADFLKKKEILEKMKINEEIMDLFNDNEKREEFVERQIKKCFIWSGQYV